MRRVLFGGAFDPIHFGHLNMAEHAHKQLGAEIYFVLAPMAVWKNSSAPVEDKINMINLAIKDRAHFHLELFEVNSGKDINYSVDTVRYFKKLYPNDEIFYLIGTDQVNKFHLWKECDELAKLAQIVFFKRPNIMVDEANIKRFSITELDGGSINPANSTDIRMLKSLDCPDEVIDYILDNGLYAVKTIKSMLSEERFAHTINVAKLAYEIAKTNNLVDAHDALVAGLLHDIAKSSPETSEIMQSYYKDYLDIPNFAHHQFVGEYISKTKFGITKPKILEAIKFHTTGNDEMSDIAKIIYAADKIEPNRKYDSTQLINAMLLKPLDEGFKIVLQANKEYLEVKQRIVDDRLTSKCFDKYLK